MPSKKKLYKITFSNQGKLYELYAKEVSNSNLLGFIEIESLVFGEKTSLVVDPSEEKIKTEFEELRGRMSQCILCSESMKSMSKRSAR